MKTEAMKGKRWMKRRCPKCRKLKWVLVGAPQVKFREHVWKCGAAVDISRERQ